MFLIKNRFIVMYSFKNMYVVMYSFNPIKAGGVWICVQTGVGGVPPQKKGLQNRYKVEMHVLSLIFQGQLVEKNTDNVNSLCALHGRVENNAKKRVNKFVFILFITSISQGYFKNIIFRSVGSVVLVTNVMRYFRFFLHRPNFYHPVPCPMH